MRPPTFMPNPSLPNRKGAWPWDGWRWRVKKPRLQESQTLEFRVKVTATGRPEFIEEELRRVLGNTFSEWELS